MTRETRGTSETMRETQGENPIVRRPTPAEIAGAQLTAFRRAAEKEFGAALPDYLSLHRFACDNPEKFWRFLWEWSGVLGEPGARTLENGGDFIRARFFPDGELNYAENLLAPCEGGAVALIEGGESLQTRETTRAQLRAQAARMAAHLRECGIVPGDRVAAVLPNNGAAIAGMLGDRLPRRDLVQLLPRLRRGRNRGALRTNRPARPAGVRRILLQRQAPRLDG